MNTSRDEIDIEAHINSFFVKRKKDRSSMKVKKTNEDFEEFYNKVNNSVNQEKLKFSLSKIEKIKSYINCNETSFSINTYNHYKIIKNNHFSNEEISYYCNKYIPTKRKVVRDIISNDANYSDNSIDYDILPKVL